jgi:hypothetical protein
VDNCAGKGGGKVAVFRGYVKQTDASVVDRVVIGHLTEKEGTDDRGSVTCSKKGTRE